jgi:hypothetical protein
MLGAVAFSVSRELHQCPGLVKLEAASETGPHFKTKNKRTWFAK